MREQIKRLEASIIPDVIEKKVDKESIKYKERSFVMETT